MANEKIVPNFNEIQIVDDAMENSVIIKNIVESKDDEDAFYIFDVGEVIRLYRKMIAIMPQVQPYYAVKCNPHPMLIKILASLGTGFDCASEREIKLVLDCGVSSDRIIFASTVKLISHIRFARKVQVDLLTVDSEVELQTIKTLFPEARIVIRFRCDAKLSMVSFGSKFGCDTECGAKNLIRKAKELGLGIHGFSFHVGSGCKEQAAYPRAIKAALNLIEYAESQGFEKVKLIDIGGGFPGEDSSIDGYAETINQVLKNIDPSIEVISEPGRYFATSPFTLANFVLGKKTTNEGDCTRYIYYINDGITGSFNFSICHSIGLEYNPVPLRRTYGAEKKASMILGHTSIARNCILPNYLLPEMNVTDWLVWPNLGAYSFSMIPCSDRIPLPTVFPFIRRSVWDDNKFLF